MEKLHAAYHAHLSAGRKGPLLMDGCPVEDLCLAFVLPGYPRFELAPNGSKVCALAEGLSFWGGGLCLAIVLPGYPRFELAPNGSEVCALAEGRLLCL